MKKFQTCTIALLIILLITSSNQRATINQLRNTINNQNSQISNLHHNIQGIHGSVNNSLANWERENRWLHSSRSTINSISDDLETLEISISWQFNELKNDEDVYLMVGRKKDTNDYEWEKVAMEADGDLYFQKTLTLPFKEEYKLDAIAENPEGKRFAELGEVGFYRSLKERFHVHGNIRASSEDKGHMFVDIHSDAYIIKDLYGYGDENQLSHDLVAKLEMESVIAEIYLNDQLVESIDLLEESRVDNSYETKGAYSYMHLNKGLEIEGLASGMISAVIKITDGFEEVYEFPLQ